MRFVQSALVAIVAIMLPGVSATHVEPCVVTSADPNTVLTLSALGRTFYREERGNPLGAPIPFSAEFLGPDTDGDGVPELFDGQGSWQYEESNGLELLQRGGCSGFLPADGRQQEDDCLIGDWFPPGCDQNPDWDPTHGTYPCLIMDEDPINDETCHAGPDTVM